MSEANGGPTIIVVPAGEGAAGEGSEGGEVQVIGAVEAPAVAAVEIAAIEAGRDIAIAEIQLEETVVRNEAYASEELEQCRLRIAELEGLNTGLLAQLESRPPLILELSSEPPPSLELPPESVAEDGPRESPVEPEALAPEPEPVKRKPHRWI